MMNRILLFVLVLAIIACKRKPFVEYKLKAEKVASDCSEQQTYFRMNSNFGGERFEFEKCLSDGFTDSKLVAERKGDTVLINFPRPVAGQPMLVYHITLDIDSHPSYGFLTVDGDTYSITSTEK